MRNIIVFTLALLFFAAACLAQPSLVWQKCLGGSSSDYAYSIQQTTDGGYIVAGVSWSNDGDVSGNHGGADYWVVKLNSSGDIEWQKSLGGSLSDYAYSIQQTSDGGYIVAGYSRSNDSDVSGHHPGGYWTWPDSGDSVWIEYFDYWVVKLNSSGDIEWQKSLGGSGNDEAYSIQQTTDGGFIVAGGSQSNDGDVSGHHGGDYYDYWVVKLNLSGDIEWQKCLGGSDRDEAYSIQQTSDGGYIVAGYSYPDFESSDYPDYWVVKLDSVGVIVWQRALGGSYIDWANSIQQTSDGGFIVAGESQSNDGDVSGHHGTPGEHSDYWIVKLNSAGDIEWQKCVGGSFSDYAYSIQQTSDSGYIVAGVSGSNDGDVSGNHGDYDYWVVKLNSAGDIVWQKCLGGGGDDEAYSIQQTSDGRFIVAGRSESNDGDVSGNHGSEWYCDYWVVKLSQEEGISDDNNRLQPLVYTISAYPNPFNSSCEITLSCHSRENGNPEGWGDVKIYDLRGNVVWKANLSDSKERLQRDAKHRWSSGTLVWTPDKSISSGIYLIKATINDQTITKRVILIK